MSNFFDYHLIVLVVFQSLNVQLLESLRVLDSWLNKRRLFDILKMIIN